MVHAKFQDHLTSSSEEDFLSLFQAGSTQNLALIRMICLTCYQQYSKIKYDILKSNKMVLKLKYLSFSKFLKPYLVKRLC